MQTKNMNNNDPMISAGYLPCMLKSTCMTQVTKFVTIPFNNVPFGDYTVSDYSEDERTDSDVSGYDSEDSVSSVRSTESTESKKSELGVPKKSVSFVVQMNADKKPQQHGKKENVKYSQVADTISKYIGNIKGI